MTKEEFKDFFMENLQIFADFNICHYNTSEAEKVRLLLTLVDLKKKSKPRKKKVKDE